MSEPNKQALTLTAEQLREMFVTFAQELRKPPEPTEAEAAQIESDKQMRRETALLQKQRMENKRFEQAACLHTRPQNNTSTCVNVRDIESMTGVPTLICQMCQGFIHPEPRPSNPVLAKEWEGHIFDTQLFNRHFLLTQTQTTF